jgi:hypothetical protein
METNFLGGQPKNIFRFYTNRYEIFQTLCIFFILAVFLLIKKFWSYVFSMAMLEWTRQGYDEHTILSKNIVPVQKNKGPISP